MFFNLGELLCFFCFVLRLSFLLLIFFALIFNIETIIRDLHIFDVFFALILS